jgi:hypothetical protein
MVSIIEQIVQMSGIGLIIVMIITQMAFDACGKEK